MILASFQPIPEQDGTPHLNSYGKWESVAGFTPIRCFNADDASTLLTNAYMFDARSCDTLLIYDTEDYKKVDLVKLYQKASDEGIDVDEVDITDCLTDSDECVDYLIDADTKPVMAFSVYSFLGVYPAGLQVDTDEVMRSMTKVWGTMVTVCPAFAEPSKFLINYMTSCLKLLVTNDSEEFMKQLEASGGQMLVRNIQTVFISCVLSSIYAVYVEYAYRKKDIRLSEAIYVPDVYHMFSSMQAQAMRVAFYNAPDEGGSPDKTKEIYDMAKTAFEKLSCNTYLTLACANQDPQRNDLCPCGSNMKYKKCHGKMLKNYDRIINPETLVQ